MISAATNSPFGADALIVGSEATLAQALVQEPLSATRAIKLSSRKAGSLAHEPSGIPARRIVCCPGGNATIARDRHRAHRLCAAR
jgi:hypothetical protein